MPRNKIYFDDAADDKVLAVLLTLASEVWTLRERFAALESVAAQRGMPLEAQIENYEFTDEQEARLAKLRNDFLGNLFRILNEPVGSTSARPRKRARRKTSRRVRRPK